MTTPDPDRGELDPDDELDAILLEAMQRICEPVDPSGNVLAHVIDTGAWVEVRGVLAADPRRPGAVGAWLDQLPRDRKVIVPSVVSARLAGMLQRRGFTPCRWYDARIGEWADDSWVRRP